MSELQHYYNNFRAGSFERLDPARCGCRGTGYALSEVDTWHKCPVHYTPGQRHPEDDHDECEAQDTNEVLDARTIAAMAAVTPAVINDDEIPF